MSGKGIKFKTVSKLFKTVSIGAEIFLKSGLCANNHSLIFPSIHSASGMYTSKSDGANFKFIKINPNPYLIQLSNVL